MKYLLFLSLAITLIFGSNIEHAYAGSTWKKAAVIGVIGIAAGAIIGSKLKQSQGKSRASGGRGTHGLGSVGSVVAIQNALNLSGFDAGTPDGQMGRQTKEAIRQFQTSIGEPATGSLSALQQQSLMALSTVQSYKLSGNGINLDNPDQDSVAYWKLMQSALIVNGYAPGPVDGHPGARTFDAVAAFQTNNGFGASRALTAQQASLLIFGPAPSENSSDTDASTTEEDSVEPLFLVDDSEPSFLAPEAEALAEDEASKLNKDLSAAFLSGAGVLASN